jgi:hypothetical protein
VALLLLGQPLLERLEQLVRIGQDGNRNFRAVKVWDQRTFKDLDDSAELGARTGADPFRAALVALLLLGQPLLERLEQLVPAERLG